MEDKPDVVDLLLLRLCNANSRDSYGRTPLHIACEKKLHVIVQKLVVYGLNKIKFPSAEEVHHYVIELILFPYI